MTEFAYRVTLDCSHLFLHGPVPLAVTFYIGEAAVCTICSPTRSIIKDAAEGKGDWTYPTRIIVNVEEIDTSKMLPSSKGNSQGE